MTWHDEELAEQALVEDEGESIIAQWEASCGMRWLADAAEALFVSDEPIDGGDGFVYDEVEDEWHRVVPNDEQEV